MYRTSVEAKERERKRIAVSSVAGRQPAGGRRGCLPETADGRGILAWVFAPYTGTMGPEDAYEAAPGAIHKSKSGLPAFVKLSDALPSMEGMEIPVGAVCMRVLCYGHVTGEKNLTSSVREVITAADVTVPLHEFACWCADVAIKRGLIQCGYLPAAVSAKRKWLRGNLTDQELFAVERVNGDYGELLGVADDIAIRSAAMSLRFLGTPDLATEKQLTTLVAAALWKHGRDPGRRTAPFGGQGNSAGLASAKRRSKSVEAGMAPTRNSDT